MSASELMPVLFAAHGAPMLLDDAGWVAELAAWGKALPRPRAILSISAHWDESPTTIGATRAIPLVYDFYGFPERFYRLEYPSPGAPELAARVRALLDAAGIAHRDDEERGLDHGTYVPRLCMFPGADVPVLQISMPGLEPRELLALGRALAPLRREGVLVFGSGFITHNMRYRGRETPGWASDFDAWAGENVARLDLDALVDFLDKGPGARTALPTTEHYVPLVIAAGAAVVDAPRVSFPITGWWMGGFTKRSVQFT
jgi:4,5-DOPA dioxygenase extradiol